MSAHTPGPWAVRKATLNRRRPSVVGSDGAPVCSCGGNAPGFGEYSVETARRQQANAALIAAAPMMLAELEALVETIEAWGRAETARDNTPEEDALISAGRLARAAIAAARGAA